MKSVFWERKDARERAKNNEGELGLLGNNSELDIFPPSSSLPGRPASYDPLEPKSARRDKTTYNSVIRVGSSKLGGNVRDDSSHVSFVELDGFLSQSVQNWRVKDVPPFLLSSSKESRRPSIS